MPIAGLLVAMSIVLVYLLLLVRAILGVLLMVATTPVFWRTRWGFVPYRLVATTESRDDATFLVFVHVVIGSIGFVLSLGVSLLLAGLDAGVLIVGGPILVPVLAWATFVARPMRAADEAPDQWRVESLASFAAYAIAYLGGSVGLALLVDAVA